MVVYVITHGNMQKMNFTPSCEYKSKLKIMRSSWILRVYIIPIKA